ncbi:D-tyrosyl-tRNA(Tyr) deacylase [Candidatus Berkelbacteria bacterium]|nr:D-tyrosyl-tRNA(Tyr) deacylase [Candidatus Berkelbacteria bacterium]
MKAVVQRVDQAAVSVGDRTVGEIGHGALVYLSIAPTDTPETVSRMASKLAELALFPDEHDRISRSVANEGHGLLLVSQFTLHADLAKVRRPSFLGAARPEIARERYEQLIRVLRERAIQVETGEFGAHMAVESVNDGPVTFLLEIDE